MLFRFAVFGFLATLASPAFAGIEVIDTPEPASMAILAVGIAGAAVVRAMRNRRR
jgi:hypothetical protein